MPLQHAACGFGKRFIVETCGRSDVFRYAKGLNLKTCFLFVNQALAGASTGAVGGGSPPPPPRRGRWRAGERVHERSMHRAT